ncbi:MAG TPA: hypothetical protein VFC63_21920 [Blastocatellia bacterium]|nr:hypothetical protein [Blastocatellia bacterium]
MLCPKCASPNTSILQTRSVYRRTMIRRRRSCNKCDMRFTTYESLEPDEKFLYLIKNMMDLVNPNKKRRTPKIKTA